MTPTIFSALQETLTGILLTLITIGLPVLVAGLIFLGRKLYAWIGVKVAESESKRDDLILMAVQEAAALFVKAAKQSGLSGAIADEAKAKKAYAIERLKAYAVSQGWDKVDIDTLDAAVEAAVRDGVHNGFNTPIAALEGEPLTQLEAIYTADTNLSEETAQSLINELVRQRNSAVTGGYVGSRDLEDGIPLRVSASASRTMSQVFAASPTAPDAK